MGYMRVNTLIKLSGMVKNALLFISIFCCVLKQIGLLTSMGQSHLMCKYGIYLLHIKTTGIFLYTYNQYAIQFGIESI